MDGFILLFVAPRHGALDHRVQVIVPALATLLPDAPRQVVRVLGPELRSILGPLYWPVDIHQVQQQSVLDVSPRTLDERWIQNLLPAVETLHISSVLEAFSDSFPVFGTHLLHKLLQLLVLQEKPRNFRNFILARKKICFLTYLGLGPVPLLRAVDSHARVLHLVEIELT